VEQNVITTVLLPVALGVIMLGLGLSLAIADFKRILQYPKAAAIGLGCQMLVLPFVCLGIAHAFDLSPPLAIGLMLLAASPGGATANLFSHLAKGDVAVNLSLEHFLGHGQAIPLQFSKIIQVVLLVLIPVAIGMTIRSRRADVANRLERPVKLISAVFLVLIVISAIIKERDSLGESFRDVGLAALAFNLASLAVGYVVPLVFRVERRQAIAIGMEIGIHNGTLAIAIASSPSLLNNPVMAIPPAIYSLIMFFTAALFGMWISKRA
jgi:BASS family bile acid:Na+ symporter